MSTYVDERFYEAVLNSYCNYLVLFCAKKCCKKRYVYIYEDNLKGVRHKIVQKEIVLDFDTSGKKISEKIIVRVRYEERSKKLFVVFSSKSCKFLDENKTRCFRKVLKCYLGELIWGLAEALLPVEEPNLNIECLLCPVIKKNYSLNLFKMPKKFFKCSFLYDDVLILLYNIWLRRKKEVAFVKIDVCDILLLRGIKVYKKEDKKRICEAIECLSAFDIIRAKKLKRYQYAFALPLNKVEGEYFIDKKLLKLNPNTKYFEKILGNYLFRLMHGGKFEFRVNTAVKYLLKHKKSLTPVRIRDKIENALDTLCDYKIIKRWEYKSINEDKLSGKNWLIEYRKLKVLYSCT